MSPARRLLYSLTLVGLAVGVFATTTTAQAAPSDSELKQQITQAGNQLEDIVEQYNKVNEQLKASKAQSAQLATKLAPMQAQADAAQGTVGALAASAYKTGQLGAISALLSSSAADGSMIDRLGFLDQLSKSRQTEVNTYTSAKKGLEDQKAKVDAAAAKQASQIAQLAAQKKSIESKRTSLLAKRQQLYGSATQTGTKYTGSIPAVSGKAGTAVTYAYNAIGAPYNYAEAGPYNTGYDCSGLTMAAWAAAGISLPHNAAMQWSSSHVTHISRSQLAAGDLVFYRSLGHVAIFVGGGKVIHAPTEGETVQLASVDMMTPYGYGRVHS